MNTITDEMDHVDPEEWERPDMRSALAVRDISRVYRLLQKIGFSQQKIAALTGQSQPEVSAILHGRKVMAYDVLSRIADGLGMPREYMGLSYGPMPADAGEASSARPSRGARSEEDDPVLRRDFIGATAAVMVGASASAYERWLPRPADPAAPAPVRIGAADIARIRETTDLLYNLGCIHLGGLAAVDAVTGFLRSTSGLLRSSCTDEVGRQLKVALADLYGIAGSMMLDVGRCREANKLHLQGLVLARDAGEHGLAAQLLWRMGRVYLDQEHASEALKMFQFAQLAAQDAGSHAELACLHQNEALAYALLGQPRQVAEALARAEHERGRMAETPEAALFHGAARFNSAVSGDLLCFEAWAHTLLARKNDLTRRSGECAVGISEQLLAPAVADSRGGVSRSLDQTMLAAGLMRAGERDAGIAAAHAAINQVEALRSARSVDRLRYLSEAVKPWERTTDGRDLRRRIAATRAV